jgi:apolipoprotein N-acyltransferase
MKNAFRIPAIILLTLISLGLGWDMLRLNQLDQLWGYRPLYLFLSAWGALVLLRAGRYRSWPQRWRWLGLSTLSALLLGLGFPDLLPVPALMFVGFVPLLIAEREISAARQGPARREVLRYAYHTFVLWNIITTYWVANTAFVAGIFAIWVNALLMCIPFLLFHQTRHLMPRLGYGAFIAYWIAFEYLHQRWELTWPWLTLGNSFAEYPSWVQWYEYSGVFGGSLWVLAANVLALRLWQAYRGQAVPLRGPILQLAGLILLPIAFSQVLYHRYEEQGPLREVVVVQPNFEPHYEKFDLPEYIQVKRMVDLAAPLVSLQTHYLLLPETSFGMLEARNINSYEAVRYLREQFEAYPQLQIVAGVDAYYLFQPGEPGTRALREVVRPTGDTLRYEVLNAAIQLSMESPEVPLYRKSKLVPGPEIFPYPWFFFFMKPLVNRLEGTVAGVGTQVERSALRSPAGRVAPVICYESIFGEYSAGYIRNGAQAIFIMTNDGWWDHTAGHRQHLYFASLRAIESRRAIARSANTGISAFINQRGDIQQPTRYDEPIAIKQAIPFNDAVTFYVRWGDILGRIALFASAIFLLNTLVRSLMPPQ